MRTRLTMSLTAAMLVVLAAPASALAKGGEGLWGRVDDKVTTYFGLALIILVPVMLTVLTIIQTKREAAKERRKADLSRLRGGD